jgi:nitrogen regulatory protein PII
MKLITAHIRPEQLPSIKKSLSDAGFPHLSAATEMGTAPSSERHMYRGVAHEVSLFDRLRIELAVRNDDLEGVLEAITAGAKEQGAHGVIFVTELVDAVSIWNGARGEEALGSGSRQNSSE